MSTDRNHTTNPITRLFWLVIIATGAIAGGSFALSYAALVDLAAANGVPGQLSYIWPLIVDVSVIVFTAAILVAQLQRRRAGIVIALTVFYAIVTIAGNVLHAPPTALGWFVAALPPLSLIFATEALRAMAHHHIALNNAQKNLPELEQAAQQLRSETAQARAQFEQDERNARATIAQLEEKIARQSAQLESQKAQRIAQLEADIAQRTAQLEAQFEQQSAQLSTDIAQLEAQREAAQNGEIDPVLREMYQIDGLLAAGLSQSKAAQIVGISASTLRNRIKNLNGDSLSHRREGVR